MREQSSDLNRAFKAYVKILKEKEKHWVVADNPVAKRDEANDLIEQQKRLDAVFRILKTGEKQSDYKHIIALMPTDPVERMQYKFDNYVTSLTYDVRKKLPTKLQNIFDDMLITFQPTGYTNAQSLVSHPDGTPLRGGLIFLNEGLYFSVGFAAKAIVLANVRDDHSYMQQDAKPALKKGVKFYLLRKPSLADSEFHSTGDPVEEGELSTHISSVKAMIFEFIVLHEFAHIILNHHAYTEATRLAFINEDQKDELNSEYYSSDTPKTTHTLEYEADQFAIDIIARSSTTSKSKLANLYAIGAFFIFLECIERELKRGVSNTHPAPLDRLQNLTDYFHSKNEKALDFRPYHKELLDLCFDWSLP